MCVSTKIEKYEKKALVILLQETHCTNAEKSVLTGFQLAGSFLSKKHGLVMFVQRPTKVYASGPISNKIKDCVVVRER